MNKPFVLYGVGTMTMVDNDNRIIKVGTLQDMAFEFSSSEEKIYGGDSMLPIFAFTKEKTATVNCTNAEFSLDWLKVSQGANLAQGGSLVGEETVTVAVGAASLGKTGIDVTSVMAYVVDDDTVLTRVAATPTATQFTVDANGELDFNVALNGKKVFVSYVYTAQNTAQVATITNASTPGFVSIRHVSKPVALKDGTTRRIHTVIYKAKADGKFQLDYKRNTAYSPKLAFEILDPQREDGTIISFTDEIL